MVAVVLCAFLLFGAATGPGHASAWWHPDDCWAFGESVHRLIDHCVSIGRPLQALWYLTFLTELGPAAEFWNHVWRALQGVAHVTAAIVAARALRRVFPHPAASLAILPFLLWPFAAESTTWRAAGCYPIAALLGFRAAEVVLPFGKPARFARGLLGALLLSALAALGSQAAAFSAPTLWTICAAVVLLRRHGA